MATRRYGDLSSEYPNRYGVVDEVENKWIHNKDQRVLASERRFPDGSLFVFDSRKNTMDFSDNFGTVMHLDRKRQFGIIKFAKVHITVYNGVFKIEGAEIRLTARSIMNIIGKSVLSLSSPVVQVLGKVFTVLSRHNQEPS